MRLIDADEMIKNLTAMKKMYDAIDLDGMIKGLQDSPTIDPVVRGEWIKEKQPKNLVRCSNCKDLFFDEYDSIITYNYCPNCGAKMDGGKE